MRGFALSLPEEIHAFILEFISILCYKAFVYSFKTFYKLEKTATMFSVHYKYEKIVFQVCILDQFPEFMTCGTFKSIPFKKKIIKKKKMLGANRSRPKLDGFEWHRKKLSQVQVNVIFLVKS